MNNLIICDLDGCLIDSAWIWRVVRDLKITEPYLWDFFNRNACAEFNKIDNNLLQFLFLKISAGFKILFLTARSEVIETETVNFIQRRTGLIFGQHFSVSFRAESDKSSPVESKRARLEGLILSGKEFEVAIDDDAAICEMYKEKGIKAYHWLIGTLPVEIVKLHGTALCCLSGLKDECLN